MKKILLYTMVMTFAVFTACKKDGDTVIIEDDSNVIVSSNISANTTWYADSVYQLAGRITVLSGASLTIQPGTLIKGEAGTGANATALIIARGGTLIANGTTSAPIIFTSVADELMPEDIAAGNIASPNLDPTINGLWGGVIVLGSAPISASNDDGADISETQIEGIPTSDPNGLYGGNDAAEGNSELSYISIRHGGANIGSGNEINGLSLGGVGTGTTISNIEIVGNQDDGIEFFGGTVNISNVVVWNVGDDGIDTDQSWAGTLDNFVVLAPSGHCFELDGPEGTMEAGHVIKNGLVIPYDGSDPDYERVSEDLINTDANSIVDLMNIYFTDIQDGQIINRIDAAGVTFSGIELNVAPADLSYHIKDGAAAPTGVTAVSNATVGANTASLSWTWAAKAGKF